MPGVSSVDITIVSSEKEPKSSKKNNTNYLWYIVIGIIVSLIFCCGVFGGLFWARKRKTELNSNQLQATLDNQPKKETNIELPQATETVKHLYRILLN